MDTPPCLSPGSNLSEAELSQSVPANRNPIGQRRNFFSHSWARVLAAAFFSALLFHSVSADPAEPFETGTRPLAKSKIDTLVFDQLARLNVEPANLCSDAVFLRRAFVDVIGSIPTSEETRRFLADTSPDKRTALIDHLLQRDEFADYWAMKWCDLLRVKAEFPVNLWPNAVQAYHRWIRTSIRDNKPYDKFVREMLTANGSNFRVPPVNFYRAMQNRGPEGMARTVALTFMGVRAERWPEEQLKGMAAFFAFVRHKSTAEWKEEIVYFAPGSEAMIGRFPDGSTVRLTGDNDPRVLFAEWLIDPKNPWFARNIANRVWSWLLGRGIVHEPDDLRPDNPPSNPELLEHLEREFVASGCNLKKLYRAILTSQVYQLSSMARGEHPEAGTHFAQYRLRRMEAEVLIDGINQITWTIEQYSSPIPEPYTVIPDGQRAIALADGSITSSFLELFGRPARDTGLEAERNNEPTAAQRMHLLNSSHIQRKIAQSNTLMSLALSQRSRREIIEELYLTILSRPPTDEEKRVVEAYAEASGSRREMVADVAWSLINGVEFLYRH